MPLLALGSELLCELLSLPHGMYVLISPARCRLTLPDSKLCAGTFGCPNFGLEQSPTYRGVRKSKLLLVFGFYSRGHGLF